MNLVYKNNMNFIKQYWNELYNILNATDVSHIRIDVSNNNINLVINNIPIYPLNSSEYLGSKIEQFFKKPSSFLKSATIIEEHINSPIHSKYMLKLESNLPNLSDNKKDYDTHLDSIPTMFMFGIGTAQQIEQLIGLIDIKRLLIVDQDFAILKASMYITDWQKIFKYFFRPNYSIEFCIEDGYKNTSHRLLGAVTKYYSYYIPYFMTYETKYFNDIFRDLKKNYFQLFNGWGFYDDEMVSLNHTVENIKKKAQIFTDKKAVSKKASVIIVGSGPSVDLDIENIRKHKDRTVVISCGSALTILEKNDITPDYHFEIERPKNQYDRIIENSSRDFLKKINFIGLNVIYPKTLELFKTAKLFFRKDDCGASLSNKNIPNLDHCNPTAVNAAISFVSKLGFKSIYLFGVDMGYKDESSHHSKYSGYNEDANILSLWKPATLNKTFEGNFNKNEIFLSTNILAWCKQRAENCTFDYNHDQKANINYYNCSDGLYIKDTIPMRSNDIKIDNIPNKKTILNDIEKNFSKNYGLLKKETQKQFNTQKKLMIKTIDKIILTLANKKIKTYIELFDILNETYSYILETKPSNRSSMTYSLLEGTISTLYSSIYTHGLLSKKIDDSFDFINYGLLIVVEFLEYAKNDILKIKF